ncbi:unnamed protein product [Closterium sp. Naga37s-1]|nr:unnamed protein product [Closterium sp. Naga37s-1]
MADEVLHALLDRVPASAPARLPNFTRHSIKGRQYPAVVPKAHDSVMGKLLLNLSPPEMNLFDAFEDVEYVRSTQPVTLQGVITQPISPEGLVTPSVSGQGLARDEGDSQAAEQIEQLQAGEEAIKALGDGGEGEIEAFVYVWANADDPDLYGSWDYEAWRRGHMEYFVIRCRSFARGWRERQGRRLASNF